MISWGVLDIPKFHKSEKSHFEWSDYIWCGLIIDVGSQLVMCLKLPKKMSFTQIGEPSSFFSPWISRRAGHQFIKKKRWESKKTHPSPLWHDSYKSTHQKNRNYDQQPIRIRRNYHSTRLSAPSEKEMNNNENFDSGSKANYPEEYILPIHNLMTHVKRIMHYKSR